MVILLVPQLCFAAFLARLSFTEAEDNLSPVTSHHNKINALTSENGLSNNTRCGWNCTIIDANFPERWKTASINPRLIKVVVEYEKTVTKQCAKQASRNSSGNATEYFTLWLPGNYKHSSFRRVLEHWFLLTSCPDTEEHIEAVCHFMEDRRTSSEEAISYSFISPFIRNHLADHGLIESNSFDSHFITAHGWLHVGFQVLFALFCVVIVFYFLAFICLFSPTQVIEKGLRQIIVEGASPVSFRSLVGNYFHSDCDCIGHKTGKLILRLVLPFVSLAAAAIALPYGNKNFAYDLSKLLANVCTPCCVILCTYYSFLKTLHQGKPYIVSCNGGLPRLIQNQLHMQPVLVIECWRFLYKCLIRFLKKSRLILPSQNRVSLLCFFQVTGFLVFSVFTIPTVIIVLLTAMLVAVLLIALVTSPAMVLFDDMIDLTMSNCLRRLPSQYSGLFVIFLFFYKMAAHNGFLWILSLAALALTRIVDEVLILLLSEESLPFVTLLALVCYYSWNSYSPFTNKYHDLSLMLYKCYHNHRHDQIPNEAMVNTTTDHVQANSTPNSENNYSKMKIPKELFDMACEELMPIRKSVCVLVWKFVLILGFLLMVFVLLWSCAGATPVTKSLVTFFTGLLPKIVTIYMIDRGREQKRKAAILEEKVPMTVQRYIKRTSSADQEQGKSGENTNEVTPSHENEDEHGELVV